MPIVRIALLGLCLLSLNATSAYGQWIESPGEGWTDVSLAHQSAQTRFNNSTTVVALSPLDSEAKTTVTTVRLTTALGLFQGVDVWLDLPYRRQTYQVGDGQLSTTGVGDTRFYLRGGPALFGVTGLPFAAALRGGVKWPTGTFESGARALSLSQGQRDWEMLLELGRSLYPWPVYLAGWSGYRWREQNEALQIDPGNEFVFYLAAGGSSGRFVWKTAVDGFLGAPTVDPQTDTQFASRELVKVIPTAGWRIGPGALKVRIRIPVYGRSTASASLLASPTLSLGYFVSWNESLW